MESTESKKDCTEEIKFLNKDTEEKDELMKENLGKSRTKLFPNPTVSTCAVGPTSRREQEYLINDPGIVESPLLSYDDIQKITQELGQDQLFIESEYEKLSKAYTAVEEEE